MRDNDFTKILSWPGYRVFQHEIHEGTKRLRLWGTTDTASANADLLALWQTGTRHRGT